MKCPDCGAPIRPSASACEFCGSPLPRAPEPAAEGRGDLFERIRQSEAYARRNSPERLAALPELGGLQLAIPLVFLAVFVAASLVISTGFALLMPCAAVVPLGFVVLGVLMAVHTWRTFQRRQSAPVEARPAIVTGKRTSISGGGRRTSARTDYYATFEFEDGLRQEYSLEEALYARLAESDAGILFSRADLALDFDRVTSSKE